MNPLDALLAGIVADPLEETRWLVLADWLEENDDPQRAELLRLHRKLLATCCEPDAHPERADWGSRIVTLLCDGVRPCAPQTTIQLPGGVPMTFSFIPPGTFLMGSNDRESSAHERPVHRVTLTRGYFLGVHPVTQAQWAAVLNGDNPSFFTGPDRPVGNVNWHDAQGFCESATALTGRGVRLPTEAEWERACRAGTTTEYHTGDGEDALKRTAWYGAADESGTCPVGRLAPNAWGLYDTHGNVFEWCSDWLAEYTSEERVDPTGAPDGQVRTCRAGGWNYAPDYCRSAFRGRPHPHWRGAHMGLRVILDPSE